MKFQVLGAAAGGGLPQWNCGCANCVAARLGEIAPATQSSLAVSVDGRDWAILNASPDIRTQIQNCPALHPTGLRDMPLRAVLVTNGDIDHVAGLLSLREQSAFTLYATADIHALLDGNAVFDAVSRDRVARRAVALGDDFELVPGLVARLFAVPGKVPLFMEGETVETGLVGEQTVGVRLDDGRRVACYVPGCAEVTDDLRALLSEADHLFFDGTLWRDDEMIALGLGHKTGARMGHVSMSGPEGAMARLEGLAAGKTFIHINNTNPVWQPDSPERRAVEAAGWGIAADGMEIAI